MSSASIQVLGALGTAGGHAHLSTVVNLTTLPEDTVKNYLQMLRKDNKVYYKDSHWHLKIFSQPPTTKQHITEQVLECLVDKRTLTDLQCLLPHVKQAILKETLESLENENKIKQMVCYKAVNSNWKKPTNPVQPTVSKPAPSRSTNPAAAAESFSFSCQDIRYKDKPEEKPPQNPVQNHPPYGPHNQYPHIRQEDPNRRAGNQQHRHRNSNSGSKQADNPRHQGAPNHPRPPHGQGNLPPGNGPQGNFAPRNGPQGNFAPRNGPQGNFAPRNGPPSNFAPRNGPQGNFPPGNGQPGNFPPGGFGRAPFPNAAPGSSRMPCNDDQRPRGPIPNQGPMQPGFGAPRFAGPPHPQQQPGGPGQAPFVPRPIRLTGIDPYTNMAYGCAKAGYSDEQGPNQPRPRVPGPALRQPAQLGFKQGTARGKGRGKMRDGNVEAQYLRDRKALICVSKEPEEKATIAAIRRDSQSNPEGVGSWDDGIKQPSQGHVKHKPKSIMERVKPQPREQGPDNSHIMLDSDEGSSEEEIQIVSGQVSSTSSISLHNESSPRPDPVMPSLQQMGQLLQEPNQPSPQYTGSPGKFNLPPSLVSIDPSSENSPSILNTTEPFIPQPDPTNLALSPDQARSLSYPPGVNEASVSSPLVTSASPHVTSPFDMELQQISSRLSSYMGLDMDSESDDEFELSRVDLPPQVSEPPADPMPPSLTSQVVPAKKKKQQLGNLLRPISMLCEQEGLEPPVLVVHNRPRDTVTPWFCQLTVETRYSSTGEGATQREAVQLAVGEIRSAMSTKRACRKLITQSEPRALMLHLMCRQRGWFPPLYHLVRGKDGSYRLTATLHGDVLYEGAGAANPEAALSTCFRSACETLHVPIPGLHAWDQATMDYKIALLGQFPGAVFGSRKVEESWWGEVTVNGVMYTAMEGFPKKWLSEQSAACDACYRLKLSVFNWNLPFVHVGRNTTFKT